MMNWFCKLQNSFNKETLCEEHWYCSSLTFLTFCLLPFSWLFRLITCTRRFLYRVKIKKTFHFPVPVVIVGNITVGGTGKTPFVIWLANILKEQGYQPGIVTRGVGGDPYQQPYWVNAYSGVREVGDEAILLAKRTQCPVVICIDRVAAVKELLAKTQCNIVISDDGLQHYRLGRDIEIAIVDGLRGFGNQKLLPAGPLREPLSRLKQVNFVVRQMLVSDAAIATNEFSMILKGDSLISVTNESHKISLDTFYPKRIHAVAAIGNPKRFFAMLQQKGFDVIPHAFPDHYFFKPEDLDFADDLPVFMTEKDAVKCHGFSSDKLWYISVDASLDKGLEQSVLQLIT